MSGFKPMLAADLEGDTSTVRFPCYAPVKLDGVRCIIINGVAMSRSLKPIPNAFIQAWVASKHGTLDWLDGELIVGPPTTTPGRESVMSRTMSGVMKKEGCPDFTFYVFDTAMPEMRGRPYRERGAFAHAAVQLVGDLRRCEWVPHPVVDNEDQLRTHEGMALSAGYEGLMVRSMDGLYKEGRATLKQGWLSKLKRFTTAEARVIDTYELMVNKNEQTRDALGHAERSTAKAGLVGGDTLGGLLCVTPAGVKFGCGGGFTREQRAKLWHNRDRLIGLTVTYKAFEYGTKDAPRFPVFVSFRDAIDL